MFVLKTTIIQLQVEDIKPSGKSYYTGLLQAFIRIYKEEGVYGLWKGHVPAQFLSITFCGAQVSDSIKLIVIIFLSC